MPPYDPAEVELLTALEYVGRQIARYGEENSREGWEALIAQTMWEAW